MSLSSHNPGAEPTSPIQQIIEQLHAPVPDTDTLFSLLATPLDSINLLPPQFRRYVSSSSANAGRISIKKYIPQLQRIIITHIAPTWLTLSSSSSFSNANAREPSSSTPLPPLLVQYFCPDSFSNASGAAGEVALLAYDTIVSTPLSDWSVQVLERLTKEYPVDRLFKAVFGSPGTPSSSVAGEAIVVKEAKWEDCVKNLCMVPDKVANWLASTSTTANGYSRAQDAGRCGGLEIGTYFNNLSRRFEELVSSLASTSSKDTIPSLTYLLVKLVNRGVFPSKPPVHPRSQPSFFLAILPSIRRRIQDAKQDTPSATSLASYSAYWSILFRSVPSELALQSLLSSLFGSLMLNSSSASPHASEASLDPSPKHRALIKQEAGLLSALMGNIGSDNDSWGVVLGLIIGKQWNEDMARVFVCWLASGNGVTKALPTFLDAVLETWASQDHVKHSLLSRHRYMTTLLLTTVSYLPPTSPIIKRLATNSHFMKGISIYISHLDQSVRRCGMLAAEVIAGTCRQKLNFGDWDGEDAGKGWCRALRLVIRERDIDCKEVLPWVEEKGSNEEDENDQVDIEEITTPAAASASRARSTLKASLFPKSTSATKPTDSDDEAEGPRDSDDESVEGYASPSSSRSASPTPAELEEIEKDPSLNVGKKKVSRPVYLLQLGNLLRGTTISDKKGPDEPHEVDKIEMALDVAEELIRRKCDYGTELDENAVNLTLSFLGLTDRFDLEGFAEKRQGALNALVACAPRKAAPALIEHFFNNQYSVDQRFVALNALAIGARELASLSIPPSRVPKERTEFASKRLPPSLHRKYILGNSVDTQVVPAIMNGISQHLLSEEKTTGGSAPPPPPEYARTRKLRITKAAPKISTVEAHQNPYTQLVQPPAIGSQKLKTRFVDVAAEYFIIPFIHAFWAFLQDEHTREERTTGHQGRSRYFGAGTGLILNALVLSQFMRTVGVLVHAARNAPEWLAVIAPEALELAVSIGTRPISRMDTGGEDSGNEDGVGLSSGMKQENKEAAVLTSSLELALVVLDGSIEVDGGRTLGLEHTALLLGVNEWAAKVFEALEKGLTSKGSGGVHEVSLSRAAAGVLLKVDEITSKWGRSMLDTR